MLLSRRLSSALPWLCGVALALVLGTPGLARADLPLGARCRKSSECATERCSENVCKTYRGTTTYYPDGAQCRMNGECASNKCSSSRCGGPKPKPPAARPTGGGGGGGGTSRTAPTPTQEPAPDLRGPQSKPLSDAEKTPCGQRLMDRGHVTGRRTAERYCKESTPAQLAAAELLLQQGYVAPFGTLLGYVKDFTEEQLACSKREWDATKPQYVNKTRSFRVKPSCRVVKPPPITASDAVGSQPLLATMRATKRFSTFLRALDKSGVGKLLEGPGPFTVVAPTDDAFAKLSSAERDAWFADKAALAEQVKLHILPAEYRIKFLETRTGNRYKTLRGSYTLFIDFDKAKFRIENALGEGELPATNGVILIVDSVIDFGK